jgi:predicted MFS family arabinose efflux permease
MNFVSMWLFNNMKYTTVLTIGTLLQICGGWIRSASYITMDFWPILIGTVLQSLSASMYWQSQNLIINKWFPQNEYGRASTLVMGTSIVMVAGFITSGRLFREADVDTKAVLNDLIWHCNIVLTAIFVFFHCAFKYAPNIPPSRVATEKPEKRNLSESFRELRSNRNFQLIAICYALMIAPYNAFGSLMSLIFTPFGITVEQISLLGSASVLVGVVSSVVFGHILDRTRAYKKSMYVGAIMPLITCIGFRNFLLSANFATIAICGILFCTAAYFTTPLCMAFSAEVTYPMQPFLVNGSLQFIL